MALSSETAKKQYNGDDTTTIFPIPFLYLVDSHLKIIHTSSAGSETTWVQGTQFTLGAGGAGNPNGGTLTVKTSPSDYTPATGETLTFKRDIPLKQEDDLPEGGPFPSDTVEGMSDLLMMVAQQIQEQIDRGVLLAETSSLSGITLPSPSASAIIAWNSAATALTNSVNIGTYRGTWTTATSYSERDMVKSAESGTVDNIYYTPADYTSGASVAIDVAASDLILVIDASAAAISAAAALVSENAAAADAVLTAADVVSTNADVVLTAADVVLTAADVVLTAADVVSATAWASKTDGIVASTDYSAKAWAVGGTGVTGAASGGHAKDWATKTDGTADDTEHSAKAWAIGGTGITSTASHGAAKEWAITAEDTTVDGTNYSALHWAAKAQAYAVAVQPLLRGSSLAKGVTPMETNGCGLLTTLNVGTSSTKPDARYLPFDKDADEYAQVEFDLPAEYGGEDIELSIHWLHPAASTYVVRFEAAVLCIGDGDSLDTTFTDATAVNDTGGTTSDEYIASITISSPTNAAAGDRVYVRIGRLGTHANDTLDVDCYLSGVEWAIDLV